MKRAGPHDGREPAQTRWSSLRPAVAVAVVLLLLAVAAAASGRGTALRSDGADRNVPDLLVDYSYTVLIVLAVAVVLGVLVALSQAGKIPMGAAPSQGRFLVGLALLLVVMAIGSRAVDFYEPRSSEEGEDAVLRERLEPAPPLAEEGEQHRTPEFRWEIALVAVAAAAAALAYALRRLRPDAAEADPGDAAEAVSLVLEEALDDLRAERDARRAVIAAYARLESTLARHGLPRRPAEAPLEYLSRILLELEVAPEAVLDLTDLFEQAKFSRRRIDEAMKDEAIDALAAVRDDLRVAA